MLLNFQKNGNQLYFSYTLFNYNCLITGFDNFMGNSVVKLLNYVMLCYVMLLNKITPVLMKFLRCV